MGSIFSKKLPVLPPTVILPFTPCQSERGCGACWDFAAVASVETLLILEKGISKRLSEQYILDSVAPGDQNVDSCTGGSCLQVLEFIMQNGVPAEDAYLTYSALKHSSNLSAAPPTEFCKISAVGKLTDLSPELKESILKIPLQQGFPVCITVKPSDQFMKFLNTPETKLFGLDPPISSFTYKNPLVQNKFHSILIIGFGKDANNNEYWIIKNSWGAQWGFNGVARIVMNMNCLGIVDYLGSACYPTGVVILPQSGSISQRNITDRNSDGNLLQHTPYTPSPTGLYTLTSVSSAPMEKNSKTKRGERGNKRERTKKELENTKRSKR